MLLAAVTGSLLAVGGSATAASGADARAARYERAVVAQVNRSRSAQGLAPLRVVPCVDAVAEARAVTLRRTQRPARVSDSFMRTECSRSLELDAAAVGPIRPRALVRSWLGDRVARSVLLARRVRAVGIGASFARGRGWHVSLLLVGKRLGGGAGGSVPVEEAAPTPTPTDLAEATAPDGSTTTGDTTSDGTAVTGDSTTDAPTTDAAAALADLSGAILAETNRRRERHGLRPLEPSTCATDFAAEHSSWMAEAAQLAHADLDALRAQCGAPAAAENIAAVEGADLDPQSVVQAWMDSPGHRANILDPTLTHLGVGVAHDATAGRWYTTQDFLDAA